MCTEKILIIDDDAAVRRLIWKVLQSTGTLIYQGESIERTKDIMSRVTFDLSILDDNLEHDSDSYYLVRMIRGKYPSVPIIFLSSKKEEKNTITALEMSVNSYITKPSSLNVFKAQVIVSLNQARMIRRRLNVYKKEKLQVGDFRSDHGRYQLFEKDLPTSLSSKEVQSIQFFLRNPKQILSKEQIYSNAWGTGDIDANTIMAFINRLRSKLEGNPKEPCYPRAAWGVGHTFTPNGCVQKKWEEARSCTSDCGFFLTIQLVNAPLLSRQIEVSGLDVYGLKV